MKNFQSTKPGSRDKINVAILAGGRSSEHDISRVSAMSIIDSLDSSRYQAVPVLIERSGEWRSTSARKLACESKSDQQKPGTLTTLRAKVSSEVRPATVTSPTAALNGVDVIFPVLHGPFGEDGTIQGLLETAGVPYVGNGVLASAVGMDKAIFKAILRDAGIEVAPGIVANSGRETSADVAKRAQRDLTFPMFVKPARLGSSIGISKTRNESELITAIELAFSHDSKILIESMVEGIEVECGVLGNEDPIVSVPGEVALADDADWYDFETKYEAGRAELHIPARISDDAAKRVQDVALEVFHAVDCSGIARVDCFVTADERVIVNELNTMPGCTPTSAYARLFEASGYPFNEVVDRLINLALERHAQRSKLIN